MPDQRLLVLRQPAGLAVPGMLRNRPDAGPLLGGVVMMKPAEVREIVDPRVAELTNILQEDFRRSLHRDLMKMAARQWRLKAVVPEPVKCPRCHYAAMSSSERCTLCSDTFRHPLPFSEVW
jgi:hypothetical protein